MIVKMTVDLLKALPMTPLGTYRYVYGEYDTDTGILWPERAGMANAGNVLPQPADRRVGVLLAARVVVTMEREPLEASVDPMTRRKGKAA